jgi:hypothetical protein
MGIGDILGDVPALNCAIGQRRRTFNKPALLDAVAHHLRQQIYPPFGRHVGLSLFHHRGNGRNRVARDDVGVAAKSFVQDELVDVGEDFGGLPVHARDRYGPAVGRKCGICARQSACGYAGRQKPKFHANPPVRDSD